MGPAVPAETQGRALLQCAVNAIQDGRWDDLTCLLQGNAHALQAARLRLEQRALEQHAARAASNLPAPVPAPAPPAPKPVPTEPPAAAAGPAAAPGYKRARVPATDGLWRALDTICRWANRAPWQALFAVQILVLCSYAPAFLYQGFIMDDAVAIERNPNVVGERASLKELLRRDFWGLPMHGAGWTNKSFRPFTTLTYRWNYLLHGLHSSGFHVVNVLLHCLTSLLVGRMGEIVLGLPGAWAAGSAALFGVHPVHTENVLYLVGRADVLAALFGAVALNVYSLLFCSTPLLGTQSKALSVKPQGEQACSSIMLVPPVLLVIASGLCKESGFTLFALFMLMELFDFLKVHTEATRSGLRMPARLMRRTRLRVGLLAATTLVVFIARYRHTGGTSLNMSPQDNPISFETSRLVRVLSYAYLHGVYARLLCWPQFLCYDYSMEAIPAVRTPLDCRLLLPLAAYVGFTAALTAALRTPPRHQRAALLSLALLVVTFFPASNVLFPVGTVIGERLLYVPSIGFCLAVAVGLHRALAGPSTAAEADSVHNKGEATTPHSRRGHRAASRESHPRHAQGVAGHLETSLQASPPAPKVWQLLAAAVVVGAVILALSVRTWLRVRVWESSETLFIHDGHAQPTSSKTQFNLGITYMQRQEWDAAVSALVRCAYADPLSSLPFYRIGQIEILRGRYQSAESWLAAAIDKFGASLMVRDEEVFHDLAVAMFQNGKLEAAERRLRIALQLNPDFAKGWNNLACCLVMQHNLYDAARASEKAVALGPDNPQYWANFALLAQHSGDTTTAAAAWRQAQELWPSIPEPRDCTWEFAPGG
mmetsp:Transcript_106240/g.342775  ORF Transcript_106240/g.342775 Transcript_106240/m.342775 type:complete len:824 (+) Transcript_106240:113-2584(+)